MYLCQSTGYEEELKCLRYLTKLSIAIEIACKLLFIFLREFAPHIVRDAVLLVMTQLQAVFRDFQQDH